MFRRLAFVLGLLLGLVSVAQAGTAILVYFLTGKLPVVEIREAGQGRRPVFKLISPDEALAFIKKQVASGRIQMHGRAAAPHGEAGHAG